MSFRSLWSVRLFDSAGNATALRLRDEVPAADPFDEVVSVHDVAFAPSGRAVAVAYRETFAREGRVRLWRADQIEPTATVTLERLAQCLALDNAGIWLLAAVGFWNRMSVEVRRTGGTAPSCVFQPKRGRVQKALYVGDGNRFAGLAGARLFIVQPGKPPLVTDPVDRRSTLRDLAVSPDGRLLVTVGDDRRSRLWDADTARLVAEYDWGVGALTAVCFAPDGQTCFAAGARGQVVVWDVDV